jgi:hypothetical protein
VYASRIILISGCPLVASLVALVAQPISSKAIKYQAWPSTLEIDFGQGYHTHQPALLTKI